MYQNMAQAYRDGEISYSRVRTFNLDEYVGLAKKHPCSYYYFMREYLFKDIDIPADNIDFLDGTASDLAQECKIRGKH
jgi:glucosamine-6-phosphate deaminase